MEVVGDSDTIAMLQMKNLIARFVQLDFIKMILVQRSAKSCPAGTMHTYGVNNDATSWDGYSENSNMLVADSSNDYAKTVLESKLLQNMPGLSGVTELSFTSIINDKLRCLFYGRFQI